MGEPGVTWARSYCEGAVRTFFLTGSGGGCTPLSSRLVSSLETKGFLRWMLMKPEERGGGVGEHSIGPPDREWRSSQPMGTQLQS